MKGFNEQALELDSLAIKADRRFQELSDEAEANFENVDLTVQHKAFIRHCGGTLNEVEIQRNEKKIAKMVVSKTTRLQPWMKPVNCLKKGMRFPILQLNVA